MPLLVLESHIQLFYRNGNIRKKFLSTDFFSGVFDSTPFCRIRASKHNRIIVEGDLK